MASWYISVFCTETWLVMTGHLFSTKLNVRNPNWPSKTTAWNNLQQIYYQASNFSFMKWSLTFRQVNRHFASERERLTCIWWTDGFRCDWIRFPVWYPIWDHTSLDCNWHFIVHLASATRTCVVNPSSVDKYLICYRVQRQYKIILCINCK